LIVQTDSVKNILFANFFRVLLFLHIFAQTLEEILNFTCKPELTHYIIMENKLNRRAFLKGLGIVGAGVLASTSPWLAAFSEVDHTMKERCRIGIIGPGSRGRFLLSFLLQNPKVDLVAFSDIYQPSLDEALKMAPHAKTYKDYRKLLEDKSIDAVIVATPLNTHCKIVLDAFQAGKNVYCEKTIGYDMSQCSSMYNTFLKSGKIFFTGQQRLFDPRYIKAMEMIHQGTFGKVNCIHAFWNRNDNWRRKVPSPNLERFINWRLYKASSKGLMTELACHQLQVGTWALQKLPQKVMGYGAITFWKDGREVFDNINCIYTFDKGEMMTWGSDISNKFYGLEEQIMGNLGTVEPERGKYFFEDIDPAPAFLQMINEWENKVFGSIPFAGTSWAPETANENHGEYILGKRPDNDGTSLNVNAFVESVITHKQPPRIAEEGYYAAILCLLGHEAITRGEILSFPDEFKINYSTYHTKAPSAL
jgi:predicted dehydrogenase